MRKTIYIFVLILLLIVFEIAACGTNDNIEGDLELPTELTLLENNYSMEIGETKNILVSNGDNLTLYFSSSNPEIVIVNNAGMITAIAGGDAIITITAKGGLSAFCNVHVTTPDIYSIILSKKNVNLSIDAEFDLTATIICNQVAVSDVVEWVFISKVGEFSDIVSVSYISATTISVKALSVGKVTIQAKSHNQLVSAEIEVKNITFNDESTIHEKAIDFESLLDNRHI